VGLKIKLNSVMVDDQDKALKFYTEVLGFAKARDIPLGHGFRWISLYSPEGHADVELALEPNANPAGKTFQAALFDQGIPATAFEVDDIGSEYQRLKALDVVFTVPPTDAGAVKIAIFADTCGNLLQIYQLKN
jgi:catechol 2,3-dioxygenase-like lactoylglutathione lyase family enzyme